MKLRDLHRELAAAGFTFARHSGCGHRVYADRHGHTLTISAHGGAKRAIRPGTLKAIRRDVRRLQEQEETA